MNAMPKGRPKKLWRLTALIAGEKFSVSGDTFSDALPKLPEKVKGKVFLKVTSPIEHDFKVPIYPALWKKYWNSPNSRDVLAARVQKWAA